MTEDSATVSAAITIGEESYRCRSAVITERLDTVPRAVLQLTKDDRLPRAVSLLNADAEVILAMSDGLGTPRAFRGVVTAACRRVEAAGAVQLEVTVEPKLFKLGKRTNLRTFLEKKAQEILQTVLDDAGVPCSFKLGASYDARPNVIQYRETDLDFVRRLAAEEGITLAWDHDANEAVFFDDPKGLGDSDESSLLYAPELGFGQKLATVQKVARDHRVVTDKVHVRTYDFEKPRALVEGKKESADKGSHALESYVYPIRTVDPATAGRFAQVLLDSIQARRDVVTGRATTCTLAVGKRFAIDGHPSEAMNQELLVVAVEIVHHEVQTTKDDSGAEGRLQTSVSFEAVPTERSAYRPARVARVAAAGRGVQVATATGASGQEIDVDSHGRVTAIFPWDREAKPDDKASVRMRTMQLPTGGSMLLPRVGWEVLVHCDEGDVDAPLVVGRLYNGTKPPPYALPAGALRSSLQTATTPGGGSTNELRTDDSKGSEEMFFNASKDMTTLVKNNTTESVGNNATLQIGGNQSLEITNSLTTVVGENQTVSVGGDEKISVETFQVDQSGGDYACAIGGNRDMKVGGDHRHTVTGDETIDVGGMKTDLVVGKVTETIAGDFALSVGGAAVGLTPADIALDVTGNHDESIGAAKIIVSFGGVSSEIGGTSMTQLIGAKVGLIDGDKSETAGGMYSSVVALAQIVEADNIVLEAEGMLTIAMGASVIVLTPASVSFLGGSVKIDGATTETAALIMDN